jgi:hypothetical protein
MAGEYSRELSAKVFTGQCRLIELGFRQGGPSGYGLRRQLIDENGVVKAELGRGEHKSLQADRVIFVPGPEEELETVRWIYRAFVTEGRPEREIAALLNAAGLNPIRATVSLEMRVVRRQTWAALGLKARFTRS